MHEYKKRQPTGTILLKFFAMSMGTLLLFLLSVVAVKAAWGMYDTFKVAVDARDSAQGQLASLEANEARLTAVVTAFDTDAGVEKEIRGRFGVALPGEGEIQIVQKDDAQDVTQSVHENSLVHIFKSLFVW